MNETTERIARCCTHHPDWVTLGEHLCAAFPTLLPRQVVSDLQEIRGVTESFGLSDPEALEIGELIVRYRLMLLTGEVTDGARLDPQVHVGRMLSQNVEAVGLA